MNEIKNTKTILFASLIAAMILPFSMVDFAEAKTDKYEVDEVSNAIQAITPYVVLDKNDIVRFTMKSNEIPLDKRTIKIAEDYFEISNSYNKQAKENPHQKIKLDSKITDKFSKFYDDVKEKKGKTEKKSKILSLDMILPEAFAWGEVCGGAPWNPQSEPTVYDVYVSWGAVNYLTGSGGYHLVPFYASNHYGDDYAKEVSAFGCNNGEMRSQGKVTSTTNFNSQQPEPNPEILSYTAPVSWWDGYVIAWHIAN